MLRFIKWTFVVLLFTGAALVGAGYWWANQPLPMDKPTVVLEVPSGSGAHAVANNLTQAGVQTPPILLRLWLMAASKKLRIQAGHYAIYAHDTPRTLLHKLAKGQVAMEKFRIAEGWNMRQLRAALAQDTSLKNDSAALSDAELMQAVGATADDLGDITKPEGMFFPDTYKHVAGVSDLVILKLAYKTMQRKLKKAWEERQPNLPLKKPYDLLKLASIIEKETGHADDRDKVSGVMINRLRIDMRLQTDPTVIYGMGAAFDGNLRKADLRRDTPFNTYTRKGLPPTPIAMPSNAALLAAGNPSSFKALYFVARQDGTGKSQFSNNLSAHNAAVRKFILKR